MRRSALKLGISLILIITIDAFPKGLERRSVDLNEQHKLRSVCICDDLRPRGYALEIEPLVEEAKFKGRVRINVTWLARAGEISLHVHPDLQISHSNIRVTRLNDVVDEDADSSEEEPKAPALVKITKIERNPNKLMIHLEKRQKRNVTCEIDITYTGNITTNKMSGIFMTQYMDSTGQKHTYVATYLRLNNARKMFPSFDELQYKAKFQLVLTRPKNMTALSNTPIEKSVAVPGDQELMQDYFQQTPEMSTYQLGFVLSDFESVAPSMRVNRMDGRELQVRVWGRKDYMEALEDVPDKIVTVVNYLQDYFNSSIKLPKLDVVAMPVYTATKASDNWGLMIFKEAELSSPLVWNTAYELTYQWIGQYITPNRWIDAAENKGLNSFLASMTTMDINPDELKGKWPLNILYSLYYGYGKTFGANRGTGIIRDAKFAKIELVFRMFYYILGKDTFRDSMRHLIRAQSMAKPDLEENRDVRSFTQTDIYDSMNAVATKNGPLFMKLTINEVADTWIDQERLPLVTVVRNYNNSTITITQKPYVRETRKSPNSWESSYRWNIPLVMQSRHKWNNSDYAPKAWLLKDPTKAHLRVADIDDKESFIVVNPEEIGLFPVNYDSVNWQLLSEYLQGETYEMIPTLTRAKLLHDSWNLAYAGELGFEIALNMTRFLKHERSHVVWEPFFTMIDHVGRRIEGSDAFQKFQNYTRSLLEPMYIDPCEDQQPGSEPSWKTHLRGLARYFLCRAGYEPCIAEAREQFKKWMTDKEPDKGNPVANEFMCPVFTYGTDEEWNFALQRVINFPKNSIERKQSERTYLLKTLAGCPKQPAKIERLLTVTIIERNSNFTDADLHLIFTMLTGNANDYTTLYDFLLAHFDAIKETFKDKPNLWLSIVRSATGFFKDRRGFGRVSSLYKTKKDGLGAAASFVAEALETIEEEMRWSEANVSVIDSWLRDYLSKHGGPGKAQDLDVLEYWRTTLSCPASTNASLAPSAS